MKKIILLFSLFFLCHNLFAQQSIRGTVKDLQNNQPIPAAIIKIPGTSDATASADNGIFELIYTSANFTKITVTAVGYESKEIAVPDKTGEILVLLESNNLSTAEIQVEGFLNSKKNIETPGSIGVVTKDDISRSNGVNIQNSVNILPGVDMQFRTIGSGSRVIIRGYGDQTNFNGIGYKAYYNDVPLTDADGTTTLDDVDFTNIANIEIYKGPASSIYGTGIGGVMSLKSDKSFLGTNFMQRGFRGSYGLVRENTSVETGTNKFNMFANFGLLNYDGYRVHSQANQDFFLVNGTAYIDSKSSLQFFGNYSFSNTALAGELDSLNFYNNPTFVDTAYIKNDAHIKNESSRVNLSYERFFTHNFVNKTSFFAGLFYNDQPSAAGLTRQNRTKFGSRTTFTFTPMLGKMSSNFVVGGEFLKNINFVDSYVLIDNVLGPIRSNQEVKPMMYSAFGQAGVNVTKSTLVTLGGSVNFIEYTINDMIAQSPTHVNQSGYKRFTPIFTPRVAVNQVINEVVSVYGSISKGFSPPSTSQVLIPQLGTVNYNLKPEEALSYELGTKGSLLNKNLNYEVAAFFMNVKDKLVTQNFAASGSNPAYSITTNAGEVKYNGVEVSMSYAYVPIRPKVISLIRPFATYTYSDFYNIDFKSNNNNDSLTRNYDGLSVPGSAPNLFNAGIDFETVQGIYTNLTYLFRDEIPLTFDNKHTAQSYGLLNAKLGYKKIFGKYINLDVFAGADNLTGATYPIQLFLNVNDLRFYVNAPDKATFYGGLAFQFMLN